MAFNGVPLVAAGTLTITTSKLGVLTSDADLVITGGAHPLRQTGVVNRTMTRLGFVQLGLAPSGPVSLESLRVSPCRVGTGRAQYH